MTDRIFAKLNDYPWTVSFETCLFTCVNEYNNFQQRLLSTAFNICPVGALKVPGEPRIQGLSALNEKCLTGRDLHL